MIEAREEINTSTHVGCWICPDVTLIPVNDTLWVVDNNYYVCKKCAATKEEAETLVSLRFL